MRTSLLLSLTSLALLAQAQFIKLSPGHELAARASKKACRAKVAKVIANTTTESVPKKASKAVKGLLNIDDPVCGQSGATKKSTAKGGPNGSLKWLNCGISKSDKSSPWTPPRITLDQIKYVDLDKALENEKSPFHSCKPYLKLFDKYAAANNIPAILLAAFAMQESSCDPKSTGDNGGAHGLMQLVGDNCSGAPGGDCADNDFNVKAAANYFKETLDSYQGDLLLAIGSYNGWFDGMTYKKATAAAKSDCCDCQNNLDYLNQFLNGWLLNKDGYQIGTFYNNLAICEN